MKRMDLTGQRFGRLTAIEYSHTENKRSYWKCKCDCSPDKYKVIVGTNLKRGNSKSCGCKNRENSSRANTKDLTGKTIKGVFIIKKEYKKNYAWYYLCRCECGREFVRIGSLLTNSRSKIKITCRKCKLIIKERPDLIEEWNFEKNKDIDIKNITTGSKKNTWWICKKCGNNWNTTIKSRCLQRSGCPRCGGSKGNNKIEELLCDLNINFEKEKRFKDCKYKNTLSFDFYLPDYNLCIEYQGEQHYRFVNYFGGEKEFYNRKKRDSSKRKYCKKTNRRLLEIIYYDYDNIENILRKELKINEK